MWNSIKYQKNKISHILETVPNHATDHNKKRVLTKNYKYQNYILCCPNCLKTYKYVDRVAW